MNMERLDHLSVDVRDQIAGTDCPNVSEHGRHYWSAVNGIYEPWLCLTCGRWNG